VAEALDDAAMRWPDDAARRARLLLRLIEEGHRALVGQQASAVRDRSAAIASTSGSLTGLYGPDHLQELREDWPT